MARSRNIKPSFFSNDDLAEIDPVGRLFFIGLWTIADCNGNLEWREKRVKAQLLPYDNCDIKEIAINLDKSGFIRFYSDGESIFVNIVNFTKHQNPHKNEKAKGSDIPLITDLMRQVVDLQGLTINPDKSRLLPEYSSSNPADSFNPLTDSFNPIPAEPEEEKTGSRKTPFPKKFKVTEKMTEWFSKQGFSIDQKVATAKWIDGMLSGGYKYVDWEAAWRNGMNKAQEWHIKQNPQNVVQFQSSQRPNYDSLAVGMEK